MNKKDNLFLSGLFLGAPYALLYQVFTQGHDHGQEQAAYEDMEHPRHVTER